jgi:peptidoglycan biosynthesis protein MviN/MurJ (putative lipid II flippase)
LNEFYRQDIPGRVVAGPPTDDTEPIPYEHWPPKPLRTAAITITGTDTLADLLMRTRERTPTPGPRMGHHTSEFKLAMALPIATAVLAATLEWADKLPPWAKSPGVLMTAMAAGTILAASYIISRGLAKSETRSTRGTRIGGEE